MTSSAFSTHTHTGDIYAHKKYDFNSPDQDKKYICICSSAKLYLEMRSLHPDSSGTFSTAVTKCDFHSQHSETTFPSKTMNCSFTIRTGLIWQMMWECDGPITEKFTQLRTNFSTWSLAASTQRLCCNYDVL